MNKRQLVVIWIAVAIAIAMYILPPKSQYYGNVKNGDAGYLPLWQTRIEPHYNVRIDITRILIQYGWRRRIDTEAEAARFVKFDF